MPNHRVPISPGDSYGSWTVISECPKRGDRRIFLCACICGEKTELRLDSLRTGSSTGCGCERTEKIVASRLKHGKARTREYTIWNSMRARCLNKNHLQYKNYGGRGITICKEWDDYDVYLNDMGTRPSKDYSIDRIDNNKGYSKENCRWATHITQSNNTRKTVYVTFRGVTKPIMEWVREMNMSYGRVRQRLSRGWSAESAFLKSV